MYDTILLPTDGSEATTDAAIHAFSHAEQYDATIHVLSIVELSSGPGTAGRDDEELDRRRRERMAAAERLVEAHAAEGVDSTTAVRVGSPARVIAEYMTEAGVDLAVMSTRARSGAKRFIFGSVTEQVIQASDTPVLAVQR
ncbi:universal stress protein [Halorientalis litorea]|jgi:nucleotide-binding universal stress UspA family protein|uniref:universal stress protein n=1 Tax=Halorientalis litorea TaxID=2931977 RepID=UPI001FF2F501|nr:universal stress protein [Halorientalis litorea]